MKNLSIVYFIVDIVNLAVLALKLSLRPHYTKEQISLTIISKGHFIVRIKMDICIIGFVSTRNLLVNNTTVIGCISIFSGPGVKLTGRGK